LVSESEVLARLSKVRDPELGRDIVSLGMVRDLRVEGDRVSFVLELTTPACPYNEQIISQAKASVHALPGVKTVDMRVTARVPHGISAQGPLSTVRNVVASGKGGVGKTTISVRRVAKELDAWFLGEIPLNSRIRQQSDAATPIVLTHAPEAAAFLELAKAVAARVSVLACQRSRPEGPTESPWAPRF
jgi:metal-sulfur cluster biosynthetic enzyme